MSSAIKASGQPLGASSTQPVHAAKAKTQLPFHKNRVTSERLKEQQVSPLRHRPAINILHGGLFFIQSILCIFN